MSIFSAKLDQLESHLQTLIEGRLARLLPAQEYREKFIRCLVDAMKSGTQLQPDGSLLAPDSYVLLVHPDLAMRIGPNQDLLQELEPVIQEFGEKAGLVFAQPPVVYLSPNNDLDRKAVEVIARIIHQPLVKTVESALPSDGVPNNIPPNAFLIVNGASIFTLDQPLVNIGRRSDNDLVIDDQRVSRAHVQLRAIRGRYVLSDLGSTGGTKVNGQRVTQRVLQPRDVISLAGVPLVYGQDDIRLGETQQVIVSTGGDAAGSDAAGSDAAGRRESSTKGEAPVKGGASANIEGPTSNSAGASDNSL
jgi:pSer/pThr/pTyr-binding forkhead associated (FHA) protein